MPGSGVRVLEHDQPTRLGQSEVGRELLVGSPKGSDLEAGMGEVKRGRREPAGEQVVLLQFHLLELLLLDEGTGCLEHLLIDPFDVVVPRGHRLERNPTIRFADLGGESWLLGDFGADSPSLRMIDRRCRDAGFNPHVAYRINDCQMAQALVAAGEGIALLPRLMLRPAHQGVAIRPLATDPPSRRVSAVRLSTRYLTPATERFTALLIAASADHAATTG